MRRERKAGQKRGDASPLRAAMEDEMAPRSILGSSVHGLTAAGLVAAVAITAMGAGDVRAAQEPDAGAAARCKKVEGKAGLQLFPPENCPDSPVGICMTGSLRKLFTLDWSVQEIAPAAGLPSAAPTILSAGGDIVLVTKFGDMKFTKTAIFDTVTGQFAGLYVAIEGGTGTLVASGVVNLETGAGKVFYRGRICPG